jgi:iron-sulfur cluster assembly accessory protein
MKNMTTEYPVLLSATDVHVTETARDMLAGLIADAEENFEGIRIYVQGGGCGGMTYSMTFADEITEVDRVLDCSGFKILVDPIALGFLAGCEIDYVADGLNSTFVFKNAFQSVGGSGKCAGCGGGGY